MKCYNHKNQEAQGICKACGKGLCKECTSETENAISCHGSCKKQAELMNGIIKNNARIISISNKRIKHLGIFSISAGILFIILGIVVSIAEIITGIIFAILGIILITFGILGIKKGSFFSQALKNKDI